MFSIPLPLFWPLLAPTTDVHSICSGCRNERLHAIFEMIVFLFVVAFSVNPNFQLGILTIRRSCHCFSCTLSLQFMVGICCLIVCLSRPGMLSSVPLHSLCCLSGQCVYRNFLSSSIHASFCVATYTLDLSCRQFAPLKIIFFFSGHVSCITLASFFLSRTPFALHFLFVFS